MKKKESWPPVFDALSIENNKSAVNADNSFQVPEITMRGRIKGTQIWLVIDLTDARWLQISEPKGTTSVIQSWVRHTIGFFPSPD